MQNNKNQPSLFQPCQIRKFPINKEVHPLKGQNSDNHHTSKDSPEYQAHHSEARYSPT